MTLCIQITIPVAGWVAPFGYPRIKACSRLPMAFRSVPRPSSPPGAKASTECPYRARDRPTMHRSHPHPKDRMRTLQHTASLNTQHTHCGRPRHHERERATTPLNTFAVDRWQPSSPRGENTYRSDMRPTARPETHQNLIYPDKDHGIRPSGQMLTPRRRPRTPPNLSSP